LDKRLKLNRQTLRELSGRELTDGELRKAAGGELTPDVRTLPLNDCIVLTGTETSGC
jgi:hypothetical protein